MGINKTTSQETKLVLTAYTGNEIVRISQPNGAGGWNNFYVLFADLVNYFGGINAAVKAATATVLPNTPTYNNGTAGLGATLTSSTNSALVVDGYTVALNDRILVKNQASAFQNGIYYVSQLGTGSVPWIPTRDLNYNQVTNINDTGAIPVINGTANSLTGWTLSTKVTTIGTDGLTYVQLSINPSQIITGSTAAGGDLAGTYPNPTINWDGWIADANTWTYSSVDGATGVVTINDDLTGKIQLGDRIKLTQTTVKYFIVTKTPTFGSGVTTLTFWGGTDYTLANAAISATFFSHVKGPFGFNTTPSKWSVLVTDTGTNRVQSTPTQNVWYNVGSTNEQIVIPIGAWLVSYSAGMYGSKSGASVDVYGTLSNANNSESNTEFTVRRYRDVGTEDVIAVYAQNLLTLTTKTTFYLNIKTGTAAAVNSIGYLALNTPTIIKAVCALL